MLDYRGQIKYENKHSGGRQQHLSPTHMRYANLYSGRGSTALFARAFFWLMVVGGAPGCSPKIQEFEISPQVLCEGDRALIRWVARGDTVIAYEPETRSAGTTNCGSQGREAAAFTLAARKGGNEVQRRIEVIQLATSGTEPIALRTNAIEGSEVVARGEKDAALWTDKVS